MCFTILLLLVRKTSETFADSHSIPKASSFSEIQFLCTTSQLRLGQISIGIFLLVQKSPNVLHRISVDMQRNLGFGSDPTDVEFQLVLTSFN